jgi:hypothetical protein
LSLSTHTARAIHEELLPFASFEWHNDGAVNSIQAGSSALEIVELELR